jgi:hypothetical protein
MDSAEPGWIVVRDEVLGCAPIDFGPLSAVARGELFVGEDVKERVDPAVGLRTDQGQ